MGKEDDDIGKEKEEDDVTGKEKKKEDDLTGKEKKKEDIDVVGKGKKKEEDTPIVKSKVPFLRKSTEIKEDKRIISGRCTTPAVSSTAPAYLDKKRSTSNECNSSCSKSY